MAIPTYDKLIRPVLELAEKGPITLVTATEAMGKVHNLTPEELSHRLASGGLTIRNRTGWAMTFLKKAGLITKVASRTYAATDRGKEFLKSHKGPIKDADLRKIPGYSEAWAAGSEKRKTKEASGDLALSPDDTATPQEVIERGAEEGDMS